MPPNRKNIRSLKDVREKVLSYTFSGAARLSGLGEERLAELEDGDEPDVYELMRLEELYDIDETVLLGEPIELGPHDGITALALLEEFQELGDAVRHRITCATRAARDAVSLRRILAGDPQEDLSNLPAVGKRNGFRAAPPVASDKPFHQGAALAVQVRSYFNLGDSPIDSMRNWIAEAFPEISVSYCRLGSNGPAGLALYDGLRGPAIVLNTEGRNRDATVRRFSLAHELAHLLIDRLQGEPLAELSRYQEKGMRAPSARARDPHYEREQRANGFAVRLLCPADAVRRAADDPTRAARELVRDWGLPPGAALHCLKRERDFDVPLDVQLHESSTWMKAEHFDTPAELSGVPIERRHVVPPLAARAYSEGKIGRDRATRFLGVPSSFDIEAVLDLYGMDGPQVA